MPRVTASCLNAASLACGELSQDTMPSRSLHKDVSVFHQFTFHRAKSRGCKAGARERMWPFFLHAAQNSEEAVKVEANAENSLITVCSVFFNSVCLSKAV